MLRMGIDVGGTFSDFVVERNGRLITHKTLSTPRDPSVAVLQGIGEIAAREGQDTAGLLAATRLIVHGTTVATNAVLTGSGARTGLLTTAGLRDALEMRGGIREEPFNNWYRPPRVLVPRHLRLGVPGRLDYQGRERTPLNTAAVRQAAVALRAAGVEAVAICFMHSHASAEHERQAAVVLREVLGSGPYLTVSADLLPQIGFYDRISTTTINAYVGPVLAAYLERLTARLQAAGFRGVLLIMQSNGGVTTPGVAAAQAVTTVLSGPAAAPVAGLAFARCLGREDCIVIDMGGTSFDAALARSGQPQMVTEGAVGGYRIAMPMLDIHTIGAGGGSIGWLDEGGLLHMGPQSAGAEPGPACYGRGGLRPTCTDADLVLGYLDPTAYLGGRMDLDPDRARAAIARDIATPLGLSVERAAAAMYQVINVDMAAGIQEITVRRGLDPREFALVVAGGAGPVHAAMVARELGIGTLVVPRTASVFCALGMLLSDFRHDYVRTYHVPLAVVDRPDMCRHLADLAAAGRATLAAEGVAPDRMQIDHAADVRYLGQTYCVTVPMAAETAATGDVDRLLADFHAWHDRLYGYALPGAAAEVLNLRAVALGRAGGVAWPPGRSEAGAAASPPPTRRSTRLAFLPSVGEYAPVPVYAGDDLGPGHRLPGPVLVELPATTLLVPPEFSLTCDDAGTLLLESAHRSGS